MKTRNLLWSVETVALVLVSISSYAACGSSDGSPGTPDAGDPDGAVVDAGPDGLGPPLTFDSGSEIPDAGTVPIDAGPPANGPGGDLGTIYCGQATCPIPGSACCVYREEGDGGGYKYSFACGGSSGGGACPIRDGGIPGVALHCSGQENCGTGKVCCFSDQGVGSRADCQSACPDGLQMCNGRRPPTNCPGAQTCSGVNDTNMGLPATYGTCGDRPM